MATDSVSTPPPNRRPKTLTQASPSSKGKQKVEDFEEEEEDLSMGAESDKCGICLCEEGTAMRGRIDSCDHYFCFVCIMEWGKVESRCPICKRRFSSICRPPKKDVFACERIVNVPVRDQVYHPLGNATMGPFDPYAQVQCSICHGEADESLLLLCDLCDSASHTYCVGLGATVPEGDWFCHDCAASRAEHANSDLDTDWEDQFGFRDMTTKPSTEADVSILDIVQESSFPNFGRPLATESSPPSQLSFPMTSSSEVGASHNDTEVGTNMSQNLAGRKFDSGARTLHHCRNVRNRIQALRENWNALRFGSLSFSSRSNDSGCRSPVHSYSVVPCNRSGKKHSPSSINFQEPPVHIRCDNDLSKKKGLNDIDKAWKMMDIARSKQHALESSRVAHQASKHTLSEDIAPEHVTNSKLDYFTLKMLFGGNKSVQKIGSDRHYKRTTLEIGSDRHYKRTALEIGVKHKLQELKFEKQGQSSTVTKSTPKLNYSSNTKTPGCFELPSSRMAQTSGRVAICHKNKGKFVQNDLHEASSNVINGEAGSTILFSSIGTRSGTSGLSDVEPEFDVVSSSGKGLLHGQERMKEYHAKRKSRERDDVKSEIQSLVKLNLKLLSGDKKLEVDVFKSVARHATHAILASCGLEQPRAGVRSFPRQICSHKEQVQQLRKSTFMPSSCRECFYIFVKDVVNSVLLDKVDSTKS